MAATTKTFEELVESKGLTRPLLAHRAKCSTSLVDKACAGDSPAAKVRLLWAFILKTNERTVREAIENSKRGTAK